MKKKKAVEMAIREIRPTLSDDQVKKVMYSLRRVQKVLGDITPELKFLVLENFKGLKPL